MAKIRMTEFGARIGAAAVALPPVRRGKRRALKKRAAAALVLEPGQVPVAYSAKPEIAPALHPEIVKAARFVMARNGEEARLRAAVEKMLLRAGGTLRRLPPAKELGWLKGNGTSWPKVLREFADLVGNEEERKRRGRAPRITGVTPAEIAELDVVLGWVIQLDLDERFVVMGKMVGLGFRRIAKLDRSRRSFPTLARLYDRALKRIVFLSGLMGQKVS